MILGVSATTFATTCTNKANDEIFKKLVEETSVIFRGKANNIGQSDSISTPVTFLIEQSWKGVSESQITVNFVHDNTVSNSLLIPKIGESEIVYAQRNVTGKIFSSYCQKVENSQGRLTKEIGNGIKIEQSSPVLIEEPQGFFSNLWQSVISLFS